MTGSSIPLAVQNDITSSAELGTGNANALDPHFKPPSEWKASLSIQKFVNFNDYAAKFQPVGWLGDGWRFHADLLGTKVQDAVMWQDLWEEQNVLTASSAAALGIASPNGTAPDGRPLFNPNRYQATPPGTPAGDRPHLRRGHRAHRHHTGLRRHLGAGRREDLPAGVWTSTTPTPART